MTADGAVTALRYHQIDDCGAYLRAPEPATFYRMHGMLTGAYEVRNLAVHNQVVLTNKTPSGLVRGFGGPQVYFALERLMQRIAVELGLDPLDVISRNFIGADAFPYRAPAGSLFDSGNYQLSMAMAVERGGLAELKARRDQARARRHACTASATPPMVEPSISNMGYITTALTPAERAKAGPKNGANASATVAIDALGSVSVTIDSVPQGQGHRTVVAQVVADVLGLEPSDVRGRTPNSIREGRLVDRRRQLLEPLRRRRRRHGAPGRDRSARQAGADRGAAFRACAAADIVFEGRQGLLARAPATQTAVPPRRRRSALGAAPAARRDGAGHSRNRVLDAGPAGSARRQRRHQQLGRLRLRVRHLRGRSRQGHRPACASTAMSRRTTPAASSTRRWPTARSAALSPRAWARR